MASTTSATREQLLRYLELFAAAFDELHSAVVKQAKVPTQYIGPHHDYPVMSKLDSGFPFFNETGFYRDSSPRDYVGMLRPRTLGGILGGYARPEIGFPMGAELASFLRSHEIGKRLDLSRPIIDDIVSDHAIDALVGDAVERYLHLYGLNAPIIAKRRDAIIRPLVFGTIFQSLDLRLVVPIALTHFEVDHFPLTETTYIVRMPKKLQLGRAQISTRGSGAVRTVVGAATHAFVSNGWTLEVDNIDQVRSSLRQSSSNVLDAIDSFFGALRIVTGISTGYAQMLWAPKRWSLDYFCDLTPVYGTTLRRYPSEYDNYGWTGIGATVTAEQLKEVGRIYKAVVGSSSEAIRLALNRLNGCLTRTDAADAILDGTIGLELLLGDDENQSLSYKLRLRAAALSILHADPAYPAGEVATKVKRLYEARSAIVHGRRRKRSKKASEPTDTSNAKERLLASDLLRFVLNVLLTHPQYQDQPSKIDEGLLLRGDEMS
ncbi:hypothetical protein JQ600_19025 [Bradyrhizobium sp. AUGA SZCCT0176]|uniref:HEPN domain-containing protein n=1 Tax=Bradyrhizobium sp. AUGA SZCCT0176 TaxID=2807664 RepID=UPI001BA90D89|nr:HEPN domain-containing protein [Bradyrhizobium sp. AUGA SZCCT0176]MBR1227026.1 hypothetical protein [Bradyrhizobium sp. AUGA SZCCT0176]